MAAADYVAASYSKLKAAAATIVQTRPNGRRNWMGSKIELPATKKAASKVAKAKKIAATKKDRKRKRDESDDSDSDSESSDSSSGSSSSSDSDSDADNSSLSSTRRRTSSTTTASSSHPKRKPLSKKERNKMSASAYRKRKKAHIDALHGVADTLKSTVAQQSDMIDEITNENKALREQLSFIQKLLGSSSAFLMPKKEKPGSGKGKEKEKVVEEVEKVVVAPLVGAPLPVAQPASPKLVAVVAPPCAVAPIATVNTAGRLTVLSPEAEKLDLSALLPKPAQPEPEVTVKKEGSEEKPMQAEQPTITTTTAVAPSNVSSAQRASIFLFVIFTCFLLFNPNSLHAPLSDLAFTQLTASFLNHQYNGGVDIPFATFTSSSSPLHSQSVSPLSFLSSFTSASAAAMLSPEAVVRQFLDGGMGDESFFSEVLDRTYAPLVRLVGEEAAQAAIMRLAGGMLTLQLKRQQSATKEAGGGVVEGVMDVVKVESEEVEGEAESEVRVMAMADVPIASQ